MMHIVEDLRGAIILSLLLAVVPFLWYITWRMCRESLEEQKEKMEVRQRLCAIERGLREQGLEHICENNELSCKGADEKQLRKVRLDYEEQLRKIQLDYDKRLREVQLDYDERLRKVEEQHNKGMKTVSAQIKCASCSDTTAEYATQGNKKGKWFDWHMEVPDTTDVTKERVMKEAKAAQNEAYELYNKFFGVYYRLEMDMAKGTVALILTREMIADIRANLKIMLAQCKWWLKSSSFIREWRILF